MFGFGSEGFDPVAYVRKATRLHEIARECRALGADDAAELLASKAYAIENRVRHHKPLQVKDEDWPRLVR